MFLCNSQEMDEWYHIQNAEEIDSPSLVLYEDRLMHNLRLMLDMVGNDTTKLMPHIKTNKMPIVIKRMISLGILNFKASTIAEVEIAAEAGATSVLIAHQLVGPKIQRFGALIHKFPKTSFSTIVDNIASAQKLQEMGLKNNINITVYIDVNSGMNRSGVEVGAQLDQLLEQLSTYTSLSLKGLHVYDGHLRDPDFHRRKEIVESELKPVVDLFESLKLTSPDLQLICGGTPSFTSHLDEQNRISSPGTCVFWDWGYAEKLTEQDFKWAALLMTRVISKPTEGIVTIDLGHKAVAAENPIDQRVKFLNLSNYELLSQSEEHGVLQVDNWKDIQVGDVFYGVPYHICPTINLYDSVSVISEGKKVDSWGITARNRKISI